MLSNTLFHLILTIRFERGKTDSQLASEEKTSGRWSHLSNVIKQVLNKYL